MRIEQPWRNHTKPGTNPGTLGTYPSSNPDLNPELTGRAAELVSCSPPALQVKCLQALRRLRRRVSATLNILAQAQVSPTTSAPDPSHPQELLRSNDRVFWRRFNAHDARLPTPLASHVPWHSFHGKLCAPPSSASGSLASCSAPPPVGFCPQRSYCPG